MAAARLRNLKALFIESRSEEASSWLLQLPDSALDLVLQQLDPCSIACTAVTCEQLSRAVPAVISKIDTSFSTPYRLASCQLWLDRHSTALIHLTQCRIVREGSHTLQLHDLPCSQLRQLHLKDLEAQLDPAYGYKGVLHDCSGLTALDLQDCVLNHAEAAAAAIAALTDLQYLSLAGVPDVSCRMLSPGLQLPMQLTCLILDCHDVEFEWTAQIRKLSALVNLKHLKLDKLRPYVHNAPPSQLVQLTCLEVSYGYYDVEQYQSPLEGLSKFTALQQLSLESHIMSPMAAEDLSGMEGLSKLTSLELVSVEMVFNKRNTRQWPSLTGLQRLSLGHCEIHPNVLPGLYRLQALSLSSLELAEGSTCEELLVAVSKLPQLTELRFEPGYQHPAPSAGSYTALTASTNLCKLQLLLYRPEELVLFRPGIVYPHLCSFNLCCEQLTHAIPLKQQQLQQLCSCCPALASLDFVAESPMSLGASSRVNYGLRSANVLTLMQLSALTRLQLPAVDAAAATVLGAVAQLLGLKQLTLQHLPHLRDPALLQLTALTALEVLTLCDKDSQRVTLRNKARWCSPPDVWLQLLRSSKKKNGRRIGG